MQKFPNICIDINIMIECKSNDELRTIFNSLYPDNKQLPDNLKLSMQMKEPHLLLELQFESKKNRYNINTLTNTIDEIMEHTTIIKELIKID